MSARNLLARSKLPEFKSWLEEEGFKILPTKGTYEMLRWRSKPRQVMPIIFERHGSDVHLTCNKAAIPFVRRWIKERDNE